VTQHVGGDGEPGDAGAGPRAGPVREPDGCLRGRRAGGVGRGAAEPEPRVLPVGGGGRRGRAGAGSRRVPRWKAHGRRRAAAEPQRGLREDRRGPAVRVRVGGRRAWPPEEEQELHRWTDGEDGGSKGRRRGLACSLTRRPGEGMVWQQCVLYGSEFPAPFKAVLCTYCVSEWWPLRFSTHVCNTDLLSC
jgi:hypothetical protein